MSHLRSNAHIASYKTRLEFRNKKPQQTILDMLSDKRQKQIQANHHYIAAVIDVLKYTVVHKIAQRGVTTRAMIV